MDGIFNLFARYIEYIYIWVDMDLIYMCGGVRGNVEFDADVKDRKSSRKYQGQEINWEIENSKNAWWITSGIQTSHSNCEAADVCESIFIHTHQLL